MRISLLLSTLATTGFFREARRLHEEASSDVAIGR
jgi:hypothetical protein